jgi:anti-anti-sigma factor
MLNIKLRNPGNASVLSLDGNIMIGETDTLRDVIQGLPSARSVTLDMSGVALVDAHGLGVLLQLRQQALARNMRFELINVSSQLRELFRITRLDSVFRINAGVVLPLPATARQIPVAA